MAAERAATGAAPPLARPPQPVGGRALPRPSAIPETPTRPSGAKRTAQQALTATPIARKKILGSLSKRFGLDQQEVDQFLEEQELLAGQNSSWADMMDVQEEEVEAQEARDPSDSGNDSNSSTRTASSATPVEGAAAAPTAATDGHRQSASVDAEGAGEEEWNTAESRGQRRQSARVAAMAKQAALAAADKDKATQAPQDTGAARTNGAKTPDRQGSAPEPARLAQAPAQGTATETPSAAVAAAAASFEAANHDQHERAKARTKAYTSLMSQMEKMCAAGHMDSTELALMLAAEKLAHRHAEASGFAPDFPPQLLATLTSYDVKHPERTVQALAPRSGDSRGYAHAALQGQQAQQRQPPARPNEPFAYLKDKHIVGQGRGSAQRAALHGGQQRDRLYARGAKHDDPLTLVNKVDADLASAGAPHGVRVDLVTHCPLGLAIAPRRPCTPSQLLHFGPVVAKAVGASHVELDEQWERWVIHEVPTQAGSGAIDEHFITEQLQGALPGATRGAAKRLCRKDEEWEKKESTPVAFYSAVSANFFPGMEVRILGRRFLLRRHQLRPSTIMCDTCGSYRHKTTKCESEARCTRCGRYGHNSAQHEAQCGQCSAGAPCVPQCMHCRGPHSAGERQCMNRPTWDRFARAYVLSRGEELSRINARGDQSRNKLLHNVSAEVSGPARGSNAVALGTRGASASQN